MLGIYIKKAEIKAEKKRKQLYVNTNSIILSFITINEKVNSITFFWSTQIQQLNMI